jgi:hypothetical protein
VRESITRTRSSPACSAASCALWYVPESLLEIWSERIRSYPASSSYALRKSCGVGCEVVGSSGAVRSRA